DVFGSRIAVVGLVPGVAEAISAATTRRLASHAGVVVQAHVPASYRRSGQVDPVQRKSEGPLEIIDVYDFDGGLRDLLLARPVDEVYIIRPDRYVAAASPLVDLDRNLNSLMNLLNGERLQTASAEGP